MDVLEVLGAMVALLLAAAAVLVALVVARHGTGR